MTSSTLADDLAVALTLAAEADLISIDRYRAQDLEVQLKPDRTEVTDGDTRVERMIRDHLASARPDDAILGEEFGSTGVDPDPGEHASSRVWVIDPIDGTANFVRGVPIWGTLISLVIDGVPQVGVVSAPALDRRWWAATGHGAWLQQGTQTHGAGQHEPARRIQVSKIGDLTDATLSYNSLKGWVDAGATEQLLSLSAAVGRTRAFGDLWSYMLLAEGAIDIAAEFDLKPWDIAALVPIIREAGGTATTIDGRDGIDAGTLLATNGTLHQSVLGLLRGSVH